jgi:CHAT domain-containing protein
LESIAFRRLGEGAVLRVAPESTAGCFLGDVRVSLANGELEPIAELRIGDILKSRNPITNQDEHTAVVEIYRSQCATYLVINDILRVTATHPVWTNDRWASAGELRVGDRLQGVDGEAVEVRSILQKDEGADVWNLYVSSEAHSFFAEGILVHNMMTKSAPTRSYGFSNLIEAGPVRERSDHLREFERKVAALTTELAKVQMLEARVKELETALEQIAEGFGGLARYCQEVVLVPGRSSHRPRHEVQTVLVEITIEGEADEFDAKRQSQLVQQIAEKTETDLESIHIRDISSGSVRVTVEMPEHTALELMGLYLRGSEIAQDLVIVGIERRPSLTQQLPRSLAQLTALSAHQVKVAFFAASPTEKENLRVGKEHRAITEALNSGAIQGKVEIIQCMATRTSDLLSTLLKHRPTVVHFSGHGMADGAIVLENEAGDSSPVTPQALAAVFSALRGNIKFVVLNACYSSKQAAAISRSIDCVVGVPKEIGDEAAISFARAFYEALALGENLQKSFATGCASVQLNGLEKPGIPKLFAKRTDPSSVTLIG